MSPSPLSSPAVHLTFNDLFYKVPINKYKKVYKDVLKGVTGKFKSGELTAIMGPSGAGKSSLLNILTGFQTSGVEGKILANGEEVKPGDKSSRERSAYIMQDDQLNPLFTVGEIMQHAARLKLGTSVPHKERTFLIDNLLDALGMVETCNTMCGTLSGGQKKRLSIALELIDNPPVLFLDEPTTGLDSLSSVQMVTLLKKLATEGRTIVCTVHQPSASLFEIFDHIYLISEGKCLYQGSSTNMIPFLKSVDLPCPEYHNPADFIMDVISGEFGCYTDKLLLANNIDWREDKISGKPSISVHNNNGKKKNSIDEATERLFFSQNPSEWYRYKCLIYKLFMQYHRDWKTTYLKLTLHTLVGLIVGLMFLNFGNDASKVFSNLGYIFVCIVYLTFTSLMPAALKFPTEVKIIKREHFNNWYKFRTYFFAFITVNIPIQLLFTAVYIITTYLMTAQILEIHRFLLFLSTSFLLTIIAEFIGLSMGTSVNPVNGVFNGSILLAIFLLLSGYLEFLNHMPVPIYYISFIGFFRYAFETMNISIYGFNRDLLECNNVHYCDLRHPTKLFTELGLSEDNLMFNLEALVVYSFACALVSYVLLMKRLKNYY